MSKEDNNTKDICKTIHFHDKIDVFDGLNLEDMCVPPQAKESSSEGDSKDSNEPDGLFQLNPLDGINLEEMTVVNKSSPSQSSDRPQLTDQDDVNFIILPGSDSDGSDAWQQKKKERHRSGRGKSPLSNNIILPPAITKKQISVNSIIEKAYHYAELTQIREKLFASLAESGGNTLLVASPEDNTGTSLLVAALGYNVACSCQKSVLLLDCNMRRSGLHSFFNLPQSYGFTELVQNNLPWQAVVKETGFEYLHILTAGAPCGNLSDYLRDSHIPNLLNSMRNKYDLIVIDTSPVLTPNRNNVNIVSLTSVVDYFLLVVKKAGTTKEHLKETKNIIEAGTGKIDGIIINEHAPAKKRQPYSKS
jgi:capsular exopolysaccharide synthesis family protein